ncbi:unnamed protein product [Lupinus luteus]|uniref:Protein kinase domain-containing protein n=1 Tax=Lupinus luteus TaxID=3873 RepID=A0AAV1XFE5_LUPLU
MQPPIFHHDMKANSILLDSNFIAKEANFGLPRLAPYLDDGDFPNHVSTIVKGTLPISKFAPTSGHYGQFLVSKSSIHCHVPGTYHRLEGIPPKEHTSDGFPSGYVTLKIQSLSVNPTKSGPKAKNSSRETSLFGGLSSS